MRTLMLLLIAPFIAISTASAQCPDATRGCEQQSADWMHRDAFFEGFDYDSGWVPGGSPLQLRVTLHLAGETEIDLGAEAVTFWDPPLTAQVPGRPESGRLAFDYGFEFRVYFRFDVTVAGIRFNVEEEVDIPSIPMDLLLMAEGQFDPFLYPPEAPFELEDSTERVPIINADLASLIGLPSRVSGGFRLDVDASLRASYQTTDVFIDALPAIQAVGETRRIAPTSVDGFGDSRDLTVHPEGLLNYLLNLRLHPVVYIEAAGRRFDLPVGPIALELLNRQNNVVFDDTNVHVPLPNIVVSPDMFDFGTLMPGDRVLMPLEIENTGESPLTIDFVVPANIEGIESLTLAPRTRRSVDVGYRPARAGELDSSLELRTNDPDAARIRINLVGETVEVGVDAGPMMMDAGGVGDAGPSFDAAGDVGPQGGVSGGCGCRTSQTGTAPPALLLFALVLWPLSRRRRQRATTHTR